MTEEKDACTTGVIAMMMSREIAKAMVGVPAEYRVEVMSGAVQGFRSGCAANGIATTTDDHKQFIALVTKELTDLEKNLGQRVPA